MPWLPWLPWLPLSVSTWERMQATTEMIGQRVNPPCRTKRNTSALRHSTITEKYPSRKSECPFIIESRDIEIDLQLH